MNIVYIIGAVVVGLIVFWHLFMFVTALCEKQYLSGDIEPVSEPYPYKASSYWLATREHARMAGLISLGNYATKRNTSIVKGLASILVSPDRTIIVTIVGAGIIGIPLKKTVLRSRLTDGRVLESSDNPLPSDPTDFVHPSLLLNASVAELLDYHRQRIYQSGAAAVPFARPDISAEWEQIDLERGGRLVRMGLARWVDPQHTMIRATLRGAFKTVFYKDPRLKREIREQHGRTLVKRAGA
jgi:hypothetical protein